MNVQGYYANANSGKGNAFFQVLGKKKELIGDDVLSYFEIKLLNNKIFDFILFRNFYTQSITIKYQVEENGAFKNSAIRDYILMSDPDCEINAERYFAIEKSKLGLNSDGEENSDKILMLRIYLAQPCKIWKEFTITDIALINETEVNLNDCKFIKSTGENNNSTFFEFNSKTILNGDKDKVDEKYLDIMKIKDQFDLKFSILK
jgi:hypothetical protein